MSGKRARPLLAPGDGDSLSERPSSPPASARASVPPPSTSPITLPPASASVPSARLVELFRDGHIVVRHDDRARLVVFTRLATPFDTLEQLVAAFGRAELALARVPRPRTALLVDSRRAPARNDAEFERRFAPIRRRIFHDFRRGCVVLQTAAGILQGRRHAKLDNLEIGVFSDPREALAYLEVDLDPRLLDPPGAG
ncbi:MAG: hypothetical protein IT372_10015 [Polyangiaceae bacterium]|nr:hypothetical protein [Polyangiaceae bacterium]